MVNRLTRNAKREQAIDARFPIFIGNLQIAAIIIMDEIAGPDAGLGD